MPSSIIPRLTFVAFDVETSGKYPLEAEVCEIAAVKYHDGQVIGTFQTLVATTRPMSAEVIAIHNITNEMLVGAPSISTAIRQFHEFIGDAYMIAHHAPFDMGFLALEFDRARLPQPQNPVFCSSLLSRKAFPESENHKLQTLIKFFKLKQGQAHRALDDAEACLHVALKVFEKIEDELIKTGKALDLKVDAFLKYQETKLLWTDYSTQSLRSHPVYASIVAALEQRVQLQIVYAGGSRPGQARTVTPLGLVRNPKDDYLVATEVEGEIPKRYFLNKITAATL